jgi:hypothetical protein
VKACPIGKKFQFIFIVVLRFGESMMMNDDVCVLVTGVKTFINFYPAVIPAPIVYIKVAAVKKLVVGLRRCLHWQF